MRSTLVLFGLLVACGGDDDAATIPPPSDAYAARPNTSVTVGPASAPGNGTVVAQRHERCKDGEHADVIVDSTGKVVEVVCAPTVVAPPILNEQGSVDIGKDNKGVVAIDGADDGVDIAGDVKSSGNNVTVYGAGPAVSVIGGSIAANGNNYTARGVTVKGNVVIDGNNGTLVLSVVEGDVIIKGNNAVVASCTVLGQIRIEGNNAVLVGNRVHRGIDAGDKNASCDGNIDANSVAINCSSSGGKK